MVTAALDALHEGGDEPPGEGGVLELIAAGAHRDVEAVEVGAIVYRRPVIRDVVHPGLPPHAFVTVVATLLLAAVQALAGAWLTRAVATLKPL